MLFINNLGIFIYYKFLFQITILSSASSCGPSFTTFDSGTTFSSPWMVTMDTCKWGALHLVHLVLALLHHLFYLQQLSLSMILLTSGLQ